MSFIFRILFFIFLNVTVSLADFSGDTEQPNGCSLKFYATNPLGSEGDTSLVCGTQRLKNLNTQYISSVAALFGSGQGPITGAFSSNTIPGFFWVRNASDKGGTKNIEICNSYSIAFTILESCQTVNVTDVGDVSSAKYALQKTFNYYEDGSDYGKSYVYALYSNDCPYLNSNKDCIKTNKVDPKYNIYNNCYILRDSINKSCPNGSKCPCNTDHPCDTDFQLTSATDTLNIPELSYCYKCNAIGRELEKLCLAGSNDIAAKPYRDGYKNGNDAEKSMIDSMFGAGTYLCGYYNDKRVGCLKMPLGTPPRPYPRIAKADSLFNVIDAPASHLFSFLSFVRPFRDSQLNGAVCGMPSDKELGESHRGTFFKPKIIIRYGDNEMVISFTKNNGNISNTYGPLTASSDVIRKTPWQNNGNSIPIQHKALNSVNCVLESTTVPNANICTRIEYDTEFKKDYFVAYQITSATTNCAIAESSKKLTKIGKVDRPPMKYSYDSEGRFEGHVEIKKDYSKSDYSVTLILDPSSVKYDTPNIHADLPKVYNKNLLPSYFNYSSSSNVKGNPCIYMYGREFCVSIDPCYMLSNIPDTVKSRSDLSTATDINAVIYRNSVNLCNSYTYCDKSFTNVSQCQLNSTKANKLNLNLPFGSYYKQNQWDNVVCLSSETLFSNDMLDMRYGSFGNRSYDNVISLNAGKDVDGRSLRKIFKNNIYTSNGILPTPISYFVKKDANELLNVIKNTNYMDGVSIADTYFPSSCNDDCKKQNLIVRKRSAADMGLCVLVNKEVTLGKKNKWTDPFKYNAFDTNLWKPKNIMVDQYVPLSCSYLHMYLEGGGGGPSMTINYFNNNTYESFKAGGFGYSSAGAVAKTMVNANLLYPTDELKEFYPIEYIRFIVGSNADKYPTSHCGYSTGGAFTWYEAANMGFSDSDYVNNNVVVGVLGAKAHEALAVKFRKLGIIAIAAGGLSGVDKAVISRDVTCSSRASNKVYTFNQISTFSKANANNDNLCLVTPDWANPIMHLKYANVYYYLKYGGNKSSRINTVTSYINYDFARLGTSQDNSTSFLTRRIYGDEPYGSTVEDYLNKSGDKSFDYLAFTLDASGNIVNTTNTYSFPLGEIIAYPIESIPYTPVAGALVNHSFSGIASDGYLLPHISAESRTIPRTGTDPFNYYDFNSFNVVGSHNIYNIIPRPGQAVDENFLDGAGGAVLTSNFGLGVFRDGSFPFVSMLPGFSEKNALGDKVLADFSSKRRDYPYDKNKVDTCTSSCPRANFLMTLNGENVVCEYGGLLHDGSSAIPSFDLNLETPIGVTAYPTKCVKSDGSVIFPTAEFAITKCPSTLIGDKTYPVRDGTRYSNFCYINDVHRMAFSDSLAPEEMKGYLRALQGSDVNFFSGAGIWCRDYTYDCPGVSMLNTASSNLSFDSTLLSESLFSRKCSNNGRWSVVDPDNSVLLNKANRIMYNGEISYVPDILDLMLKHPEDFLKPIHVTSIREEYIGQLSTAQSNADSGLDIAFTCPAIDSDKIDYDVGYSGNAIWPQTDAGEVATATCKANHVRLFHDPTRLCGPSGVWRSFRNSCVKGCDPLILEDQHIQWPAASAIGANVHPTCMPGTAQIIKDAVLQDVTVSYDFPAGTSASSFPLHCQNTSSDLYSSNSVWSPIPANARCESITYLGECVDALDICYDGGVSGGYSHATCVNGKVYTVNGIPVHPPGKSISGNQASYFDQDFLYLVSDKIKVNCKMFKSEVSSVSDLNSALPFHYNLDKVVNGPDFLCKELDLEVKIDFERTAFDEPFYYTIPYSYTKEDATVTTNALDNNIASNISLKIEDIILQDDFTDASDCNFTPSHPKYANIRANMIIDGGCSFICYDMSANTTESFSCTDKVPSKYNVSDCIGVCAKSEDIYISPTKGLSTTSISSDSVMATFSNSDLCIDKSFASAFKTARENDLSYRERIGGYCDVVEFAKEIDLPDDKVRVNLDDDSDFELKSAWDPSQKTCHQPRSCIISGLGEEMFHGEIKNILLIDVNSPYPYKYTSSVVPDGDCKTTSGLNQYKINVEGGIFFELFCFDGTIWSLGENGDFRFSYSSDEYCNFSAPNEDSLINLLIENNKIDINSYTSLSVSDIERKNFRIVKSFTGSSTAIYDALNGLKKLK